MPLVTLIVGFEFQKRVLSKFNEQADRFRKDAVTRAVFLFFYFSILFFTKIYFCFRNLQEYTSGAPLLVGRHLVAPLPGGRGFSAKSFAENLRPGPWRTGRPAVGRPAPQAARQRGGWIWPPGCRATTSHSLLKGLPPLNWLKNSKKKNTRFVVTLFIHHIMV